ncbi:hypothetical protein BD309DRAFT_779456 [Dichomitus squalens]|nr:hypothetical protein BD309DRAFT_779456 [Dichomitus squalens]
MHISDLGTIGRGLLHSNRKEGQSCQNSSSGLCCYLKMYPMAPTPREFTIPRNWLRSHACTQSRVCFRIYNTSVQSCNRRVG